MSTTTTKPDLYLVVSEDRRDGYFHLYGRITTQRYEHSAWQPYGVDDDYSDGLLYSGLRLSCQGEDASRTEARRTGREAVYGYATEYREVFSIDRRKARRMSKTLELLERGLDKRSDQRGYVKSYGEYCGRVAEVFGCKGIALQRTEEQARRSGQRWDWMSVGDGVNRINHRIELWQREGEETRGAAGAEVEAAS